MKSLRNIAFAIFGLTCWAITHGAFLSADGQCDNITYQGCGYNTVDAARENCGEYDCLYVCYQHNCVLQANGPACANACGGSEPMYPAEGSCTGGGYAWTTQDSEGNPVDVYCASGNCPSGCGEPLMY